MREKLLFPTVIHEWDFEPDADTAMLATLAKKMPTRAHGLVDGAQSSYNSVDTEILSNPLLANMRRRFQDCVDAMTDTLGLEPVVITNSWVNFLHEGHRVERHRHELSVISGAFYIEADPGSVELQFHSPLEPLRMFEHVVVQNWHNQNFNTVPCKPLTLILFPSWLSHSSKDNQTANRVTLSFNTTYKKK